MKSLLPCTPEPPSKLGTPLSPFVSQDFVALLTEPLGDHYSQKGTRMPQGDLGSLHLFSWELRPGVCRRDA